MLNPSEFRELVSGRRRGVWPAVLRCALRVAEVPYTAAVCRRNRRYDCGKARVHRAGVPVVSVGNLTLGGTGKTPMVEWLARWFRRREVAVTIISRGYGAAAGSCNDEALELRRKLPDVPHLQDPDRVAAARAAVEEFNCRAILLDDAFQHRRIGRDIDIVMLDALEPFGFGHVFPRGTLREPVGGLRRADFVALSRADMLEPARREALRSEVRRLAPRAEWLEVAHAPRGLISSSGRREAVESLRGRPVAAFCGLGNPAGFRHTLESCGLEPVEFREFADHYRYSPADVHRLTRWAERLDVAAVLCTLKDLVKLPAEQLGSRPLWALEIGLDILAGRQLLEESLQRRLAAPPAHPEG